ncbi:hypothetical protein EK21DRAFT_71043 [Setomelanomma holmii]|uniref:C2H2-type domain-containing protein n=1 Tax=Setomelanomma holmii TaxID=210430 RepID=A0A9P4H596_9PLEO|nr:hypothetical protein EK21DRAFT_71043 [Setomelanomma holmii]
MDGYQVSGAGSPYTFLDTSDGSMNYIVDQSAGFDCLQQQIMQVQPASHSHFPADKDWYKTCACHKPKARRSNTTQKYFCTICREGFVDKASWKRHEETFQERPEEFQCDNCASKYFLDKDFVKHHVEAHACAACRGNPNSPQKNSEKRHVQQARHPRRTRTGWGCGFCYHFSASWTERCNHVAAHFESGEIMADWKHSSVIYSLLRRPSIEAQWNKLLQSKQRNFIGFGWDPTITSRVAGYPDSNQTLQLQDELEYFTSNQDAASLVQKAFDLATKKVARMSIDKALPPVPPPIPPRNLYRIEDEHFYSDMLKETEPWKHFASSVLNDDFLPSGVTEPDGRMLDGPSASWYDSSL